MFINYSNHPSQNWGEEQTKEAKEYGAIVDMPFPDVEPEWTAKEIWDMARTESTQIVKKLEECNDEESAVLCQGEFTLCYAIVDSLLKKRLENVHVVSAVSKRCVIEEACENGVTSKKSQFTFAGFREYAPMMIENKAAMPSCYDRGKKECDKDKILIASLGTGNYQITKYFNPESEEKETIAETGYVFDAVVKKENPNKLILIGTKGSGWKGVIEWYGRKADAGLVKTKTKTKKYLLQKIKENKPFSKGDWKKLEMYIKEAAGFDKVKLAIVPTGATQKDQETYVELLKTALRESIDTKAEIIFDISNGFRSMPLYILMLVKYISLISSQNKEHEISYRAYYGMFEAKNEDKQHRTPLVNMTEITELTEWINAISEFRNSGSVKALYRCLEREKQNPAADREKAAMLIEDFREYDCAINTNNLAKLEKGIENIKNLDQTIQGAGLSEAAVMMLKVLQDDFKKRFQDSKYPLSNLQVKLAELFTDQGQYSHAAIAIQESVTTYVMERYAKYILLENNEELEDAAAFRKYVMEYINRHKITEYLNQKMSLHRSECKDQEEYAKKYPFEDSYATIKDEIRNVGAHLLDRSKDAQKEITLEAIEQVLRKAQACMNDDMEDRQDTDAVKTGLGEMFAEYGEQETIPEEACKDVIAWVLCPSEKGCILADKAIKDAQRSGIDGQKAKQLKKEWQSFSKLALENQTVCFEDIEARPVLKEAVHVILQQCNRQQRKEDQVDEDKVYSKERVTDYLTAKKSGYERIRNNMACHWKEVAETVLCKNF